MPDHESWDNWREHVLAEIKRMNEHAHTIHDGVVGLKVELARLQVKSGVWGLLGGVIPVIVLLVVEKMK